MAASYPNSIRTFSTKTTGQVIQPSHVNDLQDEVTAIETALLTGPLTVNGFVPSATATYDLGTTLLRYRDFFFSRNGLIGGTLGVTGAVTFSSTLNVGAVTGGLYNGQTISSTANFTGSLALAGAFALNTTAVTMSTAGAIAVAGANAGLTLGSQTGAGASWTVFNTAALFSLYGGGAQSQLTLTTGGNLDLMGSVTERDRTFAMGVSLTRSFDAGNFSGGGGTWTVQSGDVTSETYRVVGDTMWYSLNIDASDISGSTAVLTITTPSGFTIAETVKTRAANVSDGSGVDVECFVVATASGNITVNTADGGDFTAGATKVQFQIYFQVS